MTVYVYINHIMSCVLYMYMSVYVGLMNTLAAKHGVPNKTWMDLWDGLQTVSSNAQPTAPVSIIM